MRRACQGRGDTRGRVSKRGPPNNRVRTVEVLGPPRALREIGGAHRRVSRTHFLPVRVDQPVRTLTNLVSCTFPAVLEMCS